jgi:formamidopyrimidine-DNA glycosylase
VKELNEFGPEPLNKNFTPFAFLSAVKKVIRRKPKIAIKPLLMDSKFIAGIGNIYSDEILFRAKIAPTRQVKSLTPQEITAIYHAIQFILKKAIAAAGSSVGDFIRTDGSWGRMGKYHFVYGRAKERCKICGSVIKSVKFNGRTGSFCPKCQK